MAITFINAAGGSAINGLSPSVAVNTWGLAANDVLVAIACSVAATDPTISSAAGGAFTDSGIGKKLNSTSSMAVRYMFHRVAAGSVPASVTSVNSGAATDSACLVVMAFRGCRVNVSPMLTGTSATGSSTNPDSPAVTPSQNQACIVIGAATPLRDTSPSGLIANYLPATPTNTNGNDTFATTAAMAYRILAAGGGASENPPAFNSWSTSAWVACTLALSDELSGALASTETSDTASATGLAGAFGTLSATEGQDGASATGDVAWQASMAVTEAADAADFDGTVGAAGISGTLDATESSDTAIISGLAGAIGELVATETGDGASASSLVRWIAELHATEAADAAAITGLAGSIGALAATEAEDSAVATGTVATEGTFSVTESADIASANGFLSAFGTLVATETADGAAFAGFIDATGVMAATEAQDTADFVGSGLPAILGTIATSEIMDIASFNMIGDPSYTGYGVHYMPTIFCDVCGKRVVNIRRFDKRVSSISTEKFLLAACHGTQRLVRFTRIRGEVLSPWR